MAPDYRNHQASNLFPMALEAMRNKAFLASAKYSEQQTRADTRGADIRICEFADKMVRRMATMGVPMFPVVMVRSYDDQASAYARGYSKDSPSDGMWPHMGFAVDIIHSTLAYMDNPVIPHAWDIVGHVGKETAKSMSLDVVWGGDWKFYDPAHWEIKGWKEHVLLGGKTMR